MSLTVLAGEGWVQVSASVEHQKMLPHEARQVGLKLLRAADEAVLYELRDRRERPERYAE